MKFTLTTAFALVFIFATQAHTFEIQPRVSKMIYNNEELRANSGLELWLKHKGAFLYGSIDPLTILGQEIDMYSVGVGYQQTIWGNLGFHLKVGYDIPSYDPSGFGWEPIWFYQSQYLAPTYQGWARFPIYIGEIDSSFTGELGLDYSHKVWRDLSLGFFGAWKVARHIVTTHGLEEGQIPGLQGVQVIEAWDFGGYKVGILMKWKF